MGFNSAFKGLNLLWYGQVIRPQSAEKIWRYWRAGECPDVDEELSRSPVSQLLVHLELADV
jgi:hypothetical protein